MSLPLWERGLKYVPGSLTQRSGRSLPLWERGLKLVLEQTDGTKQASLPLWERGLKFEEYDEEHASDGVAPLVGAWIEIFCLFLLVNMQHVAPLVGAWIEIGIKTTDTGALIRRSPCGSVD